MKRTTLALDERVIEQIRNRARRQGITFQEYAKKPLRIGLEASATARRKPRPYRMGSNLYS